MRINLQYITIFDKRYNFNFSACLLDFIHYGMMPTGKFCNVKLRDSRSLSYCMDQGMFSIPRLRVCCYLSQVKTELYFRRGLGSVMRGHFTTNKIDYLFMPAHSKLVEYAHFASIKHKSIALVFSILTCFVRYKIDVIGSTLLSCKL